VSASARVKAAFRSFGIARNTTAVAAADLARLSSADGSGAHSSPRPRIALGLLAAAVLAGAVFMGAVQALASAPTVTTGSATAITDTAATLHGNLDPTGVETTECKFEWGTDTSYGNSAPCAEGNAFTEPSEVSAELSGLTMATTYHYRLVVTNGEGESQGEDQTFSTDGPPTLSSVFVTEVSAKAATLNAELNPNGAATTYHFEYVDDTSFQVSGFSTATKAPVPDPELAAGSSAILITAALSGLAPGTHYHYRLIADNFVGPLTGPERTFRTDPLPRLVEPGQFPGQGFLPDNRAWEMVSPPEKNGGGLRAFDPRTVVSPDGLRIGYSASAAFAGVKGTGIVGDAQYISTRGPGGWSTHGITPLPALGWSQTLLGLTRALFSQDVTRAVVQAVDLPEASGDIPEGASNLYRVDAEGTGLTTLTSPFDPEALLPPIFELFVGFLNEPIGGDSDFNHIFFSSIQPLLPGVVPGIRNVYEWDEGILRLAGILPDGSIPPGGSKGAVAEAELSSNIDTVSDDGSRVLFRAAPPGSSDQLYMRRDHTDTVWISEAEGSTPVADPQEVRYEAASPDLHKVAFTTESQLNDEDPGGSGRALYIYTDSPDPEGEANLKFIFRGGNPQVAGMSVDGSSGFFADNGLFHWDEGGAVAIDTGLHSDLVGIVSELHKPGSTVRVSADGTRIAGIAFRNFVEPGSEHLYVLYVYDSDTDKLVCASCPPSGAAATGQTTLWPQAIEDSGVGWTVEGARFLTADGRRVFFSTPSALVPEDVNGRYDAYEYDIDTGEPHLLSSGRSPQNSWFAGASANGDDAFFITEQALSAHDIDNAKDMYDARVGGGLPEPLPAPVGCEGDACQPPPVGLNDPTPASSAFSGPGNAKPCRSGLVRRHGRCVKKHSKKHHKSKKRHSKRTASHKRGGNK
jgi:hypothetical protein